MSERSDREPTRIVPQGGHPAGSRANTPLRADGGTPEGSEDQEGHGIRMGPLFLFWMLFVVPLLVLWDRVKSFVRGVLS